MATAPMLGVQGWCGRNLQAAPPRPFNLTLNSLGVMNARNKNNDGRIVLEQA
jgi:hypothetical protein